MLSYQHIYHAGNAADVHKHALLSFTLDYLAAKDKPLTYIETHAGRGLYDLAAPEARRTGEAGAGVVRALREGWFADSHPYARAIAETRRQHGADAYPGSPLIAATLLRPGDRIVLAELHPAERAALIAAMPRGRAEIRPEDGLALALSLTPPTPRRGLMLIDPSYEVKADYATLPRLIAQVHRKWNVGALMLWYPLLASRPHDPMLAALEGLALPKALRHEVRFPPSREGHGMIGSGMFVVNAPHGLGAAAGAIAGHFG